MKTRRWALAGVIAATAAGAAAQTQAPLPPPLDTLRAIQDHSARHAWGEDPEPVLAHIEGLLDEANAELRAADPGRLSGMPRTLDTVLTPLLDGSWDDPLLAAPRAWMERHRAVFEAMDALAGFGSHRIVFGGDTLALAPEQRPALEQALRDTDADPARSANAAARRLHPAWMRRHAEAGDWGALAVSLRSALRTAQRSTSVPGWVGVAYASAGEHAALREVRHAARLGMPADAAEAMIEIIDTEAARVDGLVPASIDTIRIDLLDALWHMAYTLDDNTLDMLDAMAENFAGEPDIVLAVREMAPEKFNLACAEIDAWTAACRRWWTQSPLEDPPRITADDHPILHRWLGFTSFGMTAILQSRATLATERAGTIVTLRLAAHRDRTGAWPHSLTDPMPDAESLDPLSGEPFEYDPEAADTGEPDLRPAAAAAAFYARQYAERSRARAFESWSATFWRRRPIDDAHERWLQLAPMPPAD